MPVSTSDERAQLQQVHGVVLIEAARELVSAVDDILEGRLVVAVCARRAGGAQRPRALRATRASTTLALTTESA